MTTRSVTSVASALFAFLAMVFLLVPIQDAEAIPPFARKYDMSCGSCHQGHFPRLNEFGRRFRENGYQLPEGAEAPARARRSVEGTGIKERMTVFKEVPLSFRGQLFGVVPVEPGEGPAFQNSVFSMINGGGAVAKDISFYFTWTPFPEPSLHQMKVGFHNLFRKTLGEGTLNVRVGRFFLLDFQRPSHRFLSPGVTAVSNVSVGSNSFTFAEANDGVVFYGRPGWGPFHYEIAVVNGQSTEGSDIDSRKDVFARATYTAFQNSTNQLTLGLLMYQGRSDITKELGDVILAQRDNFQIYGAELDADMGPTNLFVMVYQSRHSDPNNDGEPVSFQAYRAELAYFPNRRITTSVRFDGVASKDDESLDKLELGPHITYTAASNVLTTLAWRQDLATPTKSSLVGSVDVVF